MIELLFEFPTYRGVAASAVFAKLTAMVVLVAADAGARQSKIGARENNNLLPLIRRNQRQVVATRAG